MKSHFRPDFHGDFIYELQVELRRRWGQDERGIYPPRPTLARLQITHAADGAGYDVQRAVKPMTHVTPWGPPGHLFLRHLHTVTPEIRAAWLDFARGYLREQPAPPSARLATVGETWQATPTFPQLRDEGGRVTLVERYFIRSPAHLVGLSAAFGARLGWLRECARCHDVFSISPTAPRQPLCPACRPGRGAPRATWLPDALRPAWTVLRKRLDQRRARLAARRRRHPQRQAEFDHKLAEVSRLIERARRDAARVARGKLTADDWFRRYIIGAAQHKWRRWQQKAGRP
jgi:hypothetical protein